MPSAPRPHTIRVPRALLRGSSWLRGPGCARAPVPPMLEFCSEQAIGAHSGDSTAKAWHLLLTWVWLHSPSKLPCSFYQLPWQYAGHDCLLFPRGLQKGKGGNLQPCLLVAVCQSPSQVMCRWHILFRGWAGRREEGCFQLPRTEGRSSGCSSQVASQSMQRGLCKAA